MFSNYFFLKRLAIVLNKRIKGLILLEIFSQNKDELILGFASKEKEFWIRANLDPNISLISFPESFARARRNSVDLFRQVKGLKVAGCTIFKFERSFQIAFEDNRAMIFKMHGRRANILLWNGTQIVELFRNKLSSDLELTLNDLNKEIEVSEVTFQKSNHNPTTLIPALGKEVQAYWDSHFSALNEDQKWIELEKLLDEMEGNSIKLIDGESPKISLLAIPENTNETDDPILASNWLYEKRTRIFYVEKEKNLIINRLNQQIKKSENYILKTTDKLKLVSSKRSPEEIANIIMANLNLIKKGLPKVILNDFYTNEPIEIKLNPKLSPQRNAENLYRKSKNRHQEVTILKKNIADKEKTIEHLKKQISELAALENSKDLKKFVKDSREGKSLGKDEKVKPYHQFELDGWLVFVGKNAKANDELTLKIAKKNDLWLHAKDVSGSHVVVRQRPGQNFPTYVIEYAAAIAAFNSKRKTDSLCPVIYTPKKFVRKVKGALPGQVVVEKEEVLLIEPKDTSNH